MKAAVPPSIVGSSKKNLAAAEAAAVAEIKKAAKKSWKEKVLGASGSVSGTASILGSWQICHNVCLGIIAVLAVLGITVTGMPLLFLNKIAIPVWSLALVLLLITGILYYTKKCFSRHLLFLNTGLIIAGTPFQSVAKFQYFFWTVGGALTLASLLLFIKEKKEKKGHHEK